MYVSPDPEADSIIEITMTTEVPVAYVDTFNG